jgi:pSer/pThr/pTyr-binding forkhead associated (FHA) protein
MQELHLQYLRPTGSEGAAGAEDFVIAQFPCVVGRHPACDHCITSPLISRHHCTFFRRAGEVWVRDLGSRNGTWLNGEPVTAARPLLPGDLLQLANLPFLVRRDGFPVAAQTTETGDASVYAPSLPADGPVG